MAGRFAALHAHNYRLYVLTQISSFSGTWMQRIGQAWLVLDLTGSPAALGAVTALQFVPQTLLIPLAGVLADRMAKRTLIRAFQIGSLLQAAAFAALILSGTIELWHVYVLAVLLGTVTAIDYTSRTAFVGELVDRSQLRSAVSLNSAVGNLARILGPAVAGVIIAAYGIGWTFAVNVFLQAVGLVLLGMMRAGELRPAAPPPRASVRSQLLGGVRYVAAHPPLTIALLFQAFVGIFLLNWQVVLPLLARYTLNVGSVGLGALSAALGAGAVLGSIVAAGGPPPHPKRLLMTGITTSLALAALALISNFGLAILLLLAVGAAQILFNIGAQTLLQMNVEEAYRGRVLSLLTLALIGSTPIGSAVIGGLSDLWGVAVAVPTACAICLAGLGVTWLTLRSKLTVSGD